MRQPQGDRQSYLPRFIVHGWHFEIKSDGDVRIADYNRPVSCWQLLHLHLSFHPMTRSHKTSPATAICSRREGAIFWARTPLGRDILSRLIYGSRITLYIVALVALTGTNCWLIRRHSGGIFGWLGRYRINAHHRYFSSISPPCSGACICFGPWCRY